MKRKFQLKKYTAVFIAVIMMISSIGMVGVSASALTATFDADKNMIIENTTEGVVSNNDSAVVTGTDVVFSAGGSVTYEISNVPETGWYAISTVGISSEKSSKYYAMSVTHNGSKSASADTHKDTDTTIKTGTIYLEQGKANQFVIACDSVGKDGAEITLKQLKIEKDTGIPVSSDEETKLSVFAYSNRNCRYTNHNDDDKPTLAPSAGSDDMSWKGKAQAVNGSYVSYNVLVTEKTTYDVYSLTSSKGKIYGTLSVDNGPESENISLGGNGVGANKFDKLGTVGFEPGIHTLKLTLQGSTRLWGMKLVPVGGDMQIKSVKQGVTAITTDTPVSKSTDNFEIGFRFPPSEEDITLENISITYDGDKKVSAEFAINDKTVSVNLKEALTPDTTYTLNLKNIKAAQGTASAIPAATYTFITSGEAEESGRVACDYTDSESETITLNLIAYSSKNVGIKGRNVEVYRKAPATVAVPAPEDVRVATTVTGDNGAINIVDEIPLSSDLYPDGFPYGAYIYTVKCDYCEDLPIEIIYISRAREAELLGKLKDTTSVNDGAEDGTDDDVEPFFETYQTELGVDLDADMGNLDRSKVYRHFVGAEFANIKVFKEKYKKAIYLETINCATDATKANIKAILSDETAQKLFNMPEDKLSVVLVKDTEGKLVDALLALDEITSLDEADGLIEEKIEDVFMVVCKKADVSLDSSVLSISVRSGQSIELPLKLSAKATEVKHITLKIKSDDTTFTENVTTFNILNNAEVTSSWDAGVLTVELAYPFKTSLTDIGSITLTPATSSASHTIKVSGNVTYDVNLDTDTDLTDKGLYLDEDIPVVGGITEATYTVTVTQSNPGTTPSPSTRPSTPSTPAPSTPSTPSTPVNPDPIEPDVPVAPKGFTDIDDVSWATESINKLLELGVVSESEDGKFNPNNNIKRSEFIKLIVEALDLNDENATASFTDVAEDAWYYTYAAAAQKAGIVLGGDDGKFNPESYITRQDMSVIIARALELCGIKADAENGQLFDDDESISDYAKDAIYLLKDLGIINGTGENNFTPLGNATRAQTAKMVCGIIEVVSK